MPETHRRLDFDTLLRRYARDHGLPVFRPGLRAEETATIGRLADCIGVSRRNVQRWAVEGVPEPAAEKAASRLGYHAVDIWPDWYDLPTDGDDELVVAIAMLRRQLRLVVTAVADARDAGHPVGPAVEVQLADLHEEFLALLHQWWMTQLREEATA